MKGSQSGGYISTGIKRHTPKLVTQMEGMTSSGAWFV